MYDDYRTGISFAVAQGTLLWKPINFGAFWQTSLWRSETECTDALYMHDTIATLMPVYRVDEFFPRLRQ